MLDPETIEEVIKATNKNLSEGKAVIINNRSTRRAFFNNLKRSVWKELNRRWKQSGVGN